MGAKESVFLFIIARELGNNQTVGRKGHFAAAPHHPEKNHRPVTYSSFRVEGIAADRTHGRWSWFPISLDFLAGKRMARGPIRLN